MKNGNSTKKIFFVDKKNEGVYNLKSGSEVDVSQPHIVRLLIQGVITTTENRVDDKDVAKKKSR